ncbi:slipin family protein [Candidatus Poribacteria bacterium]|nr:slipin family protein [Candidatus Poribacteria bacterium]
MWLQWIVLIAFAAVLVGNLVRVMREYERAVMFRLGRFVGVKGPGLVWMIPLFDRLVKVDLRIHTHDVPPQDLITRDNVSVTVNAVVYRRIVDPKAAVLGVEDVNFATTQVAQTTLRSSLGRADLDTLLTERDRLSEDLQATIASQVAQWGVEILSVEIKDIQLPETMKRALARKAEAERERRAKVIHAQGELAAAQRLSEAADTLSTEPAAIHLRFLQSISEVAAERNSTLVVPLPLELLKTLMSGVGAPGEATPSAPSVAP